VEEAKDDIESGKDVKLSGSLDSIYQTRYWSGKFREDIASFSKYYLLYTVVKTSKTKFLAQQVQDHATGILSKNESCN
jgi:hypothetical protein